MSLFPRIRRTSDDPPRGVTSEPIPVLLIGGPRAGDVVTTSCQVIVDSDDTGAPVEYWVDRAHGIAVVDAVDAGHAPHCDDKVLHTPGTCVHCDAFPNGQAARVRARISFTGADPRPGWTECPATRTRPITLIDQWPGNVPAPARDWSAAMHTRDELARFQVTAIPAPATATYAYEIFTAGSDTPIATYSIPIPVTPLDEWLHAQVDADRAELERQARVAGVSLAAAAKAWPEVVDRLRWLDAIRALVDLHAADGFGRCVVCCDPNLPWGDGITWPCPTLRLVATGYTDRDGYQAEWAVA